MKPVHLIGIGMLVGLTALGALMAFAGLQWQDSNYPADSFVAAVQGGAAQPTPAAVAKPGTLSAAQIAQAATRGQTVFNQKCTSCHTIGGGKLVGPDLKGVTKTRDRAWLTGFISAPDKAFASNDPIATQLKTEFGGVMMPNVGVSAAQADDILHYVDSKSQ